MPKATPALDLDVTVLCDHLLRAVGTVGRAVGDSTFPALTCVAFFAERGQIRVVGAAQDQAISTWLGAEVHTPGSFLLPRKDLYETIATWPRNYQLRLTREAGKSRLVVHAPGFNSTLPTLPADEFPPVPVADPKGGVEFEQASTLIGLLDQVREAAAVNDSARPYLCGVHFKSDGDVLMLEGADGLRIHRTWLRAPTGKVVDMIVPALAIRHACELITPDQPLRVLFVERSGIIARLLLVQDTLQILANTTEGNYPDLDQLIPAKQTGNATLSGTNLIAALVRANRIDPMVRMTFAPGQGISPGSLRLHTVNTDGGEHVEKLAATVGGPLELGLNAPLLMSMIRAHDLGTSAPLHLGLSSAREPVTIRNDNFIGVLMPMQLPKQ